MGRNELTVLRLRALADQIDSGVLDVEAYSEDPSGLAVKVSDVVIPAQPREPAIQGCLAGTPGCTGSKDDAVQLTRGRTKCIRCDEEITSG